MAATVSAIKWQSTGSEMATEGLVTLSGAYATGGVPLTQLALGLSTVNSATFEQGAYTFKYDITNEKLLMYRSAGFTPAGTNGTSTVTGNVVVKGGTLGEAIGINPDTNAGVLSKAAASDRTIPIATYLGGTQTAGAQTFTGTAVAAGALVEVANAVSLTGITTNFRAVGF